MAEILTESFCERCGTRYTFESAAPKARLKGLKVMSRGFRNFVMSDDTSMDEAMAAARNETDREQTSHQLDAFHKTFNFCMSCRQYTCGNCWNEAEGRCLSCAPHLGQDVMPAPFGSVAAPDPFSLSGAESNGDEDRNVYDLSSAPAEPLAWPTSDLMREAEAAAQSDATPEVGFEPIAPDGAFDAAVAAAALESRSADEPPEAREIPEAADAAFEDETLAPDEEFDFAARFAAVTATSAVVTEEPTDTQPTVEAPEAAEADLADATDEHIDHPAAAAAAAATAAAAAAAKTSDLFQRFRPGQSLDDEIEAYEREQAAEAAAKTAAAAAAAAVVREPAMTAPETAGPIGASAEPVYPEPEPAPVETFEPEPVAAAEPEPIFPEPVPFPAADPRVDYVPQPTWQIVAPEAPTSDGIPAAPVQQPTQPPADTVAANGDPQWPTSPPQWPDRDASAGLPFLGRPVAPTGGIDALWAASAQEVTSINQVPQAGAAIPKPGGVQPCVSCGLSLSANARFCRRCGTRQG